MTKEFIEDFFAVSKYLIQTGQSNLSKQLLYQMTGAHERMDNDDNVDIQPSENRGPEFPPPVPSLFKEVQ